MKVGTRTCLNWNTCDFPFSPSYLNRSNRLNVGLLVDGVVQFALGVQPSHALLAVAGDQRPLDRTSGAALRTRGQAFLPTGFPHSALHDSLFSDGYVSLNIAYASAG